MQRNNSQWFQSNFIIERIRSAFGWKLIRNQMKREESTIFSINFIIMTPENWVAESILTSHNISRALTLCVDYDWLNKEKHKIHNTENMFFRHFSVSIFYCSKPNLITVKLHCFFRNIQILIKIKEFYRTTDAWNVRINNEYDRAYFRLCQHVAINWSIFRLPIFIYEFILTSRCFVWIQNDYFWREKTD